MTRILTRSPSHPQRLLISQSQGLASVMLQTSHLANPAEVLLEVIVEDAVDGVGESPVTKKVCTKYPGMCLNLVPAFLEEFCTLS